MCWACEQDAIWLAYLESQGLLEPDNPAAVEVLFEAFPVQPVPVRAEKAKAKDKAPSAADQNPFSCDDPKAG
ncbi:MAG TPA: hypothetical protein VEK31_04880 [Xanthobacteraceae bacterium]|nr:hypothetical protein [Xanthobacteraceae bacterium]